MTISKSLRLAILLMACFAVPFTLAASAPPSASLDDAPANSLPVGIVERVAGRVYAISPGHPAYTLGTNSLLPAFVGARCAGEKDSATVFLFASGTRERVAFGHEWLGVSSPGAWARGRPSLLLLVKQLLQARRAIAPPPRVGAVRGDSLFVPEAGPHELAFVPGAVVLFWWRNLPATPFELRVVRPNGKPFLSHDAVIGSREGEYSWSPPSETTPAGIYRWSLVDASGAELVARSFRILGTREARAIVRKYEALSRSDSLPASMLAARDGVVLR